MIDRREILEAASAFSLLPSIVEKDYVLGWMLAGINAHDELGESWVFKGGTCLKKCYFETYRFSEDLDFTLRHEEHLDEEFLRTAFEEVIAWVTEQSRMWSLLRDGVLAIQGHPFALQFSGANANWPL